jgi:hypothetical protein
VATVLYRIASLQRTSRRAPFGGTAGKLELPSLPSPLHATEVRYKYAGRQKSSARNGSPTEFLRAYACGPRKSGETQVIKLDHSVQRVCLSVPRRPCRAFATASQSITIYKKRRCFLYSNKSYKRPLQK